MKPKFKPRSSGSETCILKSTRSSLQYSLVPIWRLWQDGRPTVITPFLISSHSYPVTLLGTSLQVNLALSCLCFLFMLFFLLKCSFLIMLLPVKISKLFCKTQLKCHLYSNLYPRSALFNVFLSFYNTFLKIQSYCSIYHSLIHYALLSLKACVGWVYSFQCC